jgi:hypothetical protein
LQIASASKPRPFLGLNQPVVHFIPGSGSALAAHDLEIVKLAFRIHRQLRYDVPRTLPSSRQTNTKESVIERDETVAGYFRTLLIVKRAFAALARRRFLHIHCVQAFLRRMNQLQSATRMVGRFEDKWRHEMAKHS